MGVIRSRPLVVIVVAMVVAVSAASVAVGCSSQGGQPNAAASAPTVDAANGTVTDGSGASAKSGVLATQLPVQGATPSAVAASAVASPSAQPSPLPTPPPAVASPTASAALPLRIAAQLDPPTPRAGAEFVLQLSIANDGNRPARGVYIATRGPWDRWTVLGTDPTANFARDATGWRMISDVQIPAHESRSIDVHIRADAPSEDQLTFAVREAEPGELR